MSGGADRPPAATREEPERFGQRTPLCGVLSLPHGPRARDARPGVVLFNAGATHHVGPNRLSVLLARRLAAAGFATLRFDHSGIGDSPPRQDGMPYPECLLDEATEAMDHLASRTGSSSFLLSGICSGAATSFVVARRDPRVAGAALINAQGHLHAERPDATEALWRRAHARHTWRMALASSFRGRNWRRLVLGRMDLRKVGTMALGALTRLRRRETGPADPLPALLAAEAKQAVEEVLARGVRLYHLYAEGDEGWDYFQLLLGSRGRRLARHQGHRVEVLRGANHLFTQRWCQAEVLDRVLSWAGEGLRDEARRRRISPAAGGSGPGGR